MYRSSVKLFIIFMTVIGFLFFSIPSFPADVELSAGLIPKPGTIKTAKDQFKKNSPWKFALSLPGVGNSWIVQMLEET